MAVAEREASRPAPAPASGRDSWGLAEGDALTPELSVIKKLGGGAAYEAFLAFDEVSWTAVAVKMVRPGQVGDRATLRGLRREVATLRALAHPALLRLLRAEEEGERPHIVLEHLDGPRLSSLVRRYGRLEPQQYLPLAIEVASALHYLHGQGYVHLDVKPSNIIMGAPAKLIDLSVARTVERAAEVSYPLGTDFYMAPEQCDPPRTGQPVPASDVFGLGATLFEAIAGHRAYADGDAHAEAVEDRWPQLVDAPALLPEDVPLPVAEVVMACLAPDPAQRPAPREIADELADLLGRLPKGRLTGLATSIRRR